MKKETDIKTALIKAFTEIKEQGKTLTATIRAARKAGWEASAVRQLAKDQKMGDWAYQSVVNAVRLIYGVTNPRQAKRTVDKEAQTIGRETVSKFGAKRAAKLLLGAYRWVKRQEAKKEKAEE